MRVTGYRQGWSDNNVILKLKLSIWDYKLLWIANLS